jgi:hypothetical protein
MSCPEEQKPGLVASVSYCQFGACASYSVNQAGYSYLNLGVGAPKGYGVSVVATDNMHTYCTGWTGQSGKVAFGGNEGSVAAGYSKPTSWSMTYGLDMDPGKYMPDPNQDLLGIGF